MRDPSVQPSLPALVGCVVLAGFLTACGGGGGGPDEGACSGVAAGALVITEVMTDPPGVDTGQEYFELYNASTEGIELKGITVSLSKLDGSSKKDHVIKSGTLPPGGYIALGDVREETLPSHILYSYGDALGSMGNAEGVLAVSCGKTLVDEVKWETATRAGRARMLDGRLAPDASLNDSATAFCEAEVEFQTGMYGSPGAPNPSCGGVGGGCQDPLTGETRAVVSPQEGDLVITELMANPSVVEDAAGEWFEIFARAEVDLNGLELSNGTGKTVLSSPTCIRMPERSIAVFAKKESAAENGGLPFVTGTFTFSLVNSNGTVLLRMGEQLIDQVTYTATQDGASLQLDPGQLDSVANDDVANFCGSATGWALEGGGTSVDKGSPGTENATCPGSLPNGQCVDGTSGQPRAIVPPQVGDLVITEVMSDPSAVADTAGEWFEVLVKTDVDLNGVELSFNGVSKQSLSTAECIRPGANSYVLFARSTDPTVNGGLPDKVLAKFAFGLTNGAGNTLSLSRNSELLDAYEYGTTPAGTSKQVSSTQLTSTANDVAANSCATSTTSTYGLGDRGTPAAANEVCL